MIGTSAKVANLGVGNVAARRLFTISKSSSLIAHKTRTLPLAPPVAPPSPFPPLATAATSFTPPCVGQSLEMWPGLWHLKHGLASLSTRPFGHSLERCPFNPQLIQLAGLSPSLGGVVARAPGAAPRAAPGRAPGRALGLGPPLHLFANAPPEFIIARMTRD